MMNDLTLDLGDKTVADAFTGDRVGDTCVLDNVQLRVKRISQSHNDEYGKDGKPTGKKVVSGSIDFEVQGFDYGDSSYDLTGGKEKSKGGEKMPMEAPPAPTSGGSGKKSALVVAIGLGKPKGK